MTRLQVFGFQVPNPELTDHFEGRIRWSSSSCFKVWLPGMAIFLLVNRRQFCRYTWKNDRSRCFLPTINNAVNSRSNRPSQPTLFWCVAARIIDIAIHMESCIPTCHLLFLRAGNFLARAFWMQQILAKVSEICCTIQGTNISHLWKRIKSWTQKCFGKGYVIVSWRVSLWILNSSRCWGACDCQITLGEGFKMTLVNGK